MRILITSGFYEMFRQLEQTESTDFARPWVADIF